MQQQPEPMKGPNSNSMAAIFAPGTESYIAQFEQHKAMLSGQKLDWMNEIRHNSLARFGKDGFPNQKQEDWRYTSLKSVVGKQYQLNSDKSQSINVDQIALIPELESIRLVFVDGVLNEELSSLSACNGDIAVQTMADALERNPEQVRCYFGKVAGGLKSGFGALNSALHQDGIFLEVKSGVILDTPIEIIFASNQELALAQPRNLVSLGEGAKAQVIERYVSLQNSKTLCNGITEIVLDQRAELDYFLIQEQSNSANQVCGVWAQQKSQSRFSCHTITLGGALVRNDLRSEMLEPDSHCDMYGVYNLSGRQHVDNHTTMIHGAENCTSNELYKGVLDQRSRAIFHGRIKVEIGAQKTDAKQSNNTLLLSRDAEIDTKPQLEIYADDVKCSHGATIGQLDETSLFYLRSRGIDLEQARLMLTYAFINDVLGQINIEPLKNYLEDVLSRQLINENLD